MFIGILVCAIYIVILLGISKIFGTKYTEIAASTRNIVRGIIYPVGICSVVLTTFAIISGWYLKVFSYSPRVISWILWIIPIVILLGIVARFTYFKYTHLDRTGLLALAFGTFLVGYSEELLVRGFLTDNLRNSGYSVIMVGIISSAVFGILHFMNFFVGQTGLKTSGQVIITTLMGLNFYIIYIISGTLWLPILFHFVYDFSLLMLNPKTEIGKGFRPNFILANIVALNILPLLSLFVLAKY